MNLRSPFARIVVGYDDSPAAETALLQAIVIAEQFGGEVAAVHATEFSAPTVLHVQTRALVPVPHRLTIIEALEPRCRLLFEKLSARAATCYVPVRMTFVHDKPASAILAVAARWCATAATIGNTARTGVAHLLTGRIAGELLRRTDVPIILTRAGCVRAAVRRVIVGVAASEPSLNPSVLAATLGRRDRALLYFCTVTNPANTFATLAELSFDVKTPSQDGLVRNALYSASEYAKAAGVYPGTEIIEASDAGVGLCDAARRRDADVIVIGTHTCGNLDRFFVGNTAESTIRQADRPVIVVPIAAQAKSDSIPRLHLNLQN